MNETAGTPLPMNSTPMHPKLKLSLSFSDKTFIAGDNVCGALEMGSHGGGAGERGKELGIGSMMVEMWGVEELLSRDHTAKAPFLYCRRLFQGPGLPPSNAVHAHPVPNMQPLPAHYYLAKKGQSSFNFRMPLPSTSPSSIMFANAARVRYEVRASVQVFWKGEKKVVIASKEVDVVESYADIDFGRDEPEAVAVGENGKIWMQGRLVGGVLVAGESACIELQVKNHSTRKNSSLSLSLTRTLHISNAPKELLISDTLGNHPFRGPDFIIPPGAEGVASLVFEVPRAARSVRGGLLEGLDGHKPTQALFEVKAGVTVKLGMGMGRNDIVVEIPVIIAHPSVIPELPLREEDYRPPQDYYDSRAQSPYDPRVVNPYGAASPYQQPYHPAVSPALAYVDPNQHLVWLPPPGLQYPAHTGQPYYYPPPHPQPYSPDSNPLRSQNISPNSYMPPPTERPIPSGLPAQSSPSDIATQVALPTIVTNHLASAQNPGPPAASPPSQTTTPAPAQPLRIDMNNLAPLDLSPHGSSPVVHSPRPFLSPKLTPTADPLNNPFGRSERVEELERMADEQDQSTVEPKEISALDKTLPSPPVPSGKASATQSRPRADVYFAVAEETTASKPVVQEVPKVPAAEPFRLPPPHEKSKPILVPTLIEETHTDGFMTPATPTLTALAHPSHKKSPHIPKKKSASLSPPPADYESGLDALERRLLAEVGTRKVRERQDTPTALLALGLEPKSKAIDIPSPSSKDSKEEGDSAISSLSLGCEDEKEWDERTHRGGASKSAPKEKEEKIKNHTESGGKSKRSSDRKETREGKSKRKMQSSKGRVAEWLGGVAAGGEAVEEGLPFEADDLEKPFDGMVEIKITDMVKEVASVAPEIVEEPAKDDTKATVEEEETPHPRSSGFMPIGTFKRDAYTRTLIPKDANPWADEPIRLKSVAGPEQTNPWKHAKKGSGLPSFTPLSRPVDNEVHYDVRSARGGRGGKVTSVAAIFASAAKNDASASTPSTPSPFAKGKSGNGGKASPRLPYSLGKSPVVSSVAVSSSHATPTLSSSASLARPPTNKPVASKGWKPVVTSVSETIQDDKKSATPNAPGYVFGQAKLKDLINKYQHP